MPMSKKPSDGNVAPPSRDRKVDRDNCSLPASDGASAKDVEKMWLEEVECRLSAYERGEMAAVKIEDVIRKYK